MSRPTVVQPLRLQSPVVDDDALVQHRVVDVVNRVARNWFDVAREHRTAMRVDRRQHELRQVTSYTSAPSKFHTNTHNGTQRGAAVGRWTCDWQVAGSISSWSAFT